MTANTAVDADSLCNNVATPHVTTCTFTNNFVSTCITGSTFTNNTVIIVEFLQNATIEYSSESVCVSVFLCFRVSVYLCFHVSVNVSMNTNFNTS